MSQEDVEIVRRMTEPYEGKDIVPVLRNGVDEFGTDPDPELVLAYWGKDPSWRHMDPELEWDTTGVGGAGTKAKGPKQVALWWAEWVGVWKSYAYRTVEFRDLGDWVMTPTDIEARGPGDIPVEMRIFQLWKVRDDKVLACRAFLTEPQALEAAGQ